MQSIESNQSVVHFNKACYPALNELIRQEHYSTIFIIVDTNTHEMCLPRFLANLETDLTIEIIEIPDGEAFKNLETCLSVWEAMSELNGDRKSLLINLGGGVVTDLGGFVGSCFKRGIHFVNVPTSLLAMVDASVGGKNGVDLGKLKNQIGVINNPELVLIDTEYLATLPQNQMRSGLAEMLKHGIIHSKSYWQTMKDLSRLTRSDLDALIHESVLIKNSIVLSDPTENGIRKTLNFGHTLGHAIESFYLEHESLTTLLHGEAVAVGMILAAYISHKQEKLSEKALNEITDVILNTFDKIVIEQQYQEEIMDLMKYDKKNTHGNINFVLINDIGSTVIDRKVSNSLIAEAFNYYNTL